MLDGLLLRLGGRSRVIGALTAAAVIGVVVWIVAEAVLYVAVFGSANNGTFSGSWITWTQVVSRLANDVWLGALALLLLLWLVSSLAGSSSPPSDIADDRDTDLPS
jgi:hypothetical protein